jgi:hypothetical protein
MRVCVCALLQLFVACLFCQCLDEPDKSAKVLWMMNLRFCVKLCEVIRVIIVMFVCIQSVDHFFIDADVVVVIYSRCGSGSCYCRY